MADRNERHFLEFYTPARQRIGWRATRRHLNTEHQQKHRATPPSDEKENPNSGRGEFGAVPATIPGEKAVGIGRQRRRLFTRSSSKQNFSDYDHGGKTAKNGFRSSNGLASVGNEVAGTDLTLVSMSASNFASPTDHRSTVPRALFSNDLNATPTAGTINEKVHPSNFHSPQGTDFLLTEYRSKQSLLSSSKIRTSTFSSPISGGLRLRRSAFWKTGKRDKENGNDHHKNSHNSPSNLEVDSGKVNSNKQSFSSVHENSPTETTSNTVVRTTPTSTNESPITPKTTPTRPSFWSPPGTSRLLRKYRIRAQQQYQDESFQSTPDGKAASESINDRSQTTPSRRRGIRLLDSGAKRCRNYRLSLRLRAAADEVTTSAAVKIPEIREDAESKDSIKTTHNNRSLLSPSTAKRVSEDIQSYRRATKTITSPVTEKESTLQDKRKMTSVEKMNGTSNYLECNQSVMDHGNDEGLEIDPNQHFSASNDAEGKTIEPSTKRNITDSLPYDEQNVANPFDDIITARSNHRPFVETEISEDTVITTVDSGISVAANPSDEDAIENYVFRDCEQTMRGSEKFTSSPHTPGTNTKDGEENAGGVFRSTRSATRARRKSLRDASEVVNNLDSVATDSEDHQNEGNNIFGKTRTSTRALLKSTYGGLEQTGVSLSKSKDSQDEGVRIVRSTRSVTSACIKSEPSVSNEDDQDKDSGQFQSTSSTTSGRGKISAEVAIENIIDHNDVDAGVFRSTRSATRARRKSMFDAAKAASNIGVDNNLSVDGAACKEANVSSSGSASSPQNRDDTPSSKGSLQSIWDALYCVGGDDSNNSNSSPDNRHDIRVETYIDSRVGNCVNPVATTLMKMWREEEKLGSDPKKEPESLLIGGTKADRDSHHERDAKVANALSATSFESDRAITDCQRLCGLKTPPRKSFSADLNLVYGLERVQNLTMARPRALQATRTTSLEPSVMVPVSPNPTLLASCSQ